MGDRRRRRPGKEVAPEYTSSWGPRDGNMGNDAPTVIVDDQGCKLFIDSNKIPDTPLWRAQCNGRRCTAISKRTNEAYHMYNTLLKCQHPNILEPIGVWLDPSDSSKAYIAVNLVDNALNSLEKEQLFHVDGNNLNGFSELGFKMFWKIFSAIDYVNTNYKGRTTSSGSISNQIELFPMMVEPRNIFLRMTRDEPQVFLGNFKLKLSEQYIQKTKRNRIESSREDFVAAHWKEIAISIETISHGYQSNEELTELVKFLKQGEVRYDELLWQTGLWDATTKMHFIREIFWLLDDQRDERKVLCDSFAKTARGRQLMKEEPLGLLSLMQLFTPPVDKSGCQLKVRDDNLLDSVTFLRNKIVAHYHEEYPLFKGDKNEIGTSKVTVEKYVLKQKPDYMINLAKTIRKLGWIDESPILRSETDYMKTFSKMNIKK